MSIDFPKEELAVIEKWREIEAFKRQIELSKGRTPYVFYDGPPFATGLPHYGHLLASTIKDIIPRYWSMKGYHVERRFGWDTHGIPIEGEIDKKFKITGKQAVMEMGLARYNAECRAIVMRYREEWRATIERLGRWIDFDNDYRTMQPVTHLQPPQDIANFVLISPPLDFHGVRMQVKNPPWKPCCHVLTAL
jgi:isoleucyl-tRNA synthetase